MSSKSQSLKSAKMQLLKLSKKELIKKCKKNKVSSNGTKADMIDRLLAKKKKKKKNKDETKKSLKKEKEKQKQKEIEKGGRVPTVVNIGDVKIKQSIKDIIFGYIRDTYSDDIPPLIIYWCLLYYYEKEEFFSKCIRNDTISIINDCTAKGLMNTDYKQPSYIFGHKIIKKSDNCTYIWSFKILGDFPDPTTWWPPPPLQIGITDKMEINDKEKGPFYFFCSDGQKSSIKLNYYPFNTDYLFNTQYEQYGATFGVNDVIKMKFNVPKNTLRFYVNDKAQGIAFNGITFGNNEKYKMTVCINAKDISVQLIDFTKKNR